jgi:hypothetical protein
MGELYLSVPRVAALLQWNRWRTYRLLRRLGLLKDIGGRKFVSRHGLIRELPDIAEALVLCEMTDDERGERARRIQYGH